MANIATTQLLAAMIFHSFVGNAGRRYWSKNKHMISALSGSSGFIGSHLHKALLSQGHKVLTISQELLYSPKDLEAFFKTEQPEYIFHLAAYGNHNNQRDIAMTVFANIIGTFNILNASKDIKYRKFVNFSTSSVTLERETFYSAAKAGAERITNAFLQEYKKPIVTVRPYSIFGEGEADFRFIPTVINEGILGNHPINLDPSAVHDWVYVGDFIDALLAIVVSSQTGIIPLGTGKQHTNEEIVEMLEQIAKTTLRRIILNLRVYDTSDWKSPQPTVKSDVMKGLKKTYAYYKKRYENN